MSFQFDGSTQIDTIDCSSVSDTHQILFHCWLNIKDIGSAEAYIWSNASGGKSKFWTTSSNARLRFDIDAADTTQIGTTSPTDLFDNNVGWAAIDIVADTARGYVKFYKNLVDITAGDIQPSANYVATGTADTNTANELHDSGTDFSLVNIDVGDIAYNVTDDTTAVITSITNAASGRLGLDSDAFPDGNESYRVVKSIQHGLATNVVGGRGAAFMPDGSMIDQVYVSNAFTSDYVSSTGELTAKYVTEMYDLDPNGVPYRKQASLAAASGSPYILLENTNYGAFNTNNGTEGNGVIDGTAMPAVVPVPTVTWTRS